MRACGCVCARARVSVKGLPDSEFKSEFQTGVTRAISCSEMIASKCYRIVIIMVRVRVRVRLCARVQAQIQS